MKKWLFNILIALALVWIMPVGAFSATREISIYLYRDYADCVFFVSWQNTAQTAAIQIKSPDETIIDATAANTVFGTGYAAVNVGSAGSGYWVVYVDGEGLGSISVSGGSKSAASATYNAIQDFTAAFKDGYVNFTWRVMAEQDTINVAINTIQGGGYGNRTVFNDYYANKNGTASISADDLQTGLYTFSIQVYDGSAQYTLAIDTPVFVKQSNAPEKLTDVRVGSIDGEIFITWQAQTNERYNITLYDYETLSVLETTQVYDHFYPVTLADAITAIKISVAAVDGHIFGDFDVYEIMRTTPSGVVTFPDYATTRESAMPIRVDCPADTTAGVYLNGTLLLENAGSGDYDIHLSEGIHEIVAYVKDGYGNMRTFSKQITVDRTPPAILLNNDDVIQTASDSIVIEGSTEPNATIAINGVEQALGMGSFMAKLALENGVNPISVSAYDTAGNKSVKTITAERTAGVDPGWTVFIVPGVVFVMLTVWYVYLNKKPKGVSPDEKAG